jgi:hypothetical protein
MNQDVFSAVFEICFLTCLQSCECKFVILFCDFLHYALAVNMSLSGVDKQDFRPAPRPKRKLQTSDGANSSIASPNQFGVLQDSEFNKEDTGVAPQPNSQSPGHLPLPIVTHSYLNNHYATLKTVNESLATPVYVKSKSRRLLLHTKISYGLQCTFGWNSNRQASLPYLPTTQCHSTTDGPQGHST